MTATAETVEERLRALELAEQNRQSLPKIVPSDQIRGRAQLEWNEQVERQVIEAELYDKYLTKERAKIEARKREAEALAERRGNAIGDMEARHRGELVELRQGFNAEQTVMEERHVEAERKAEAKHRVGASS